VLVEGCPKLQLLGIAHCVRITGAGLERIAGKCTATSTLFFLVFSIQALYHPTQSFNAPAITPTRAGMLIDAFLFLLFLLFLQARICDTSTSVG